MSDAAQPVHNAKILPYVHLDGVPTLRDSDLLGLYDRMDREGLAGSCYQEGRLHWLEEMKSRRSLLYVCMGDDGPMGMVWLNAFRGRYAHSHLVIFRAYHGRANILTARWAIQTVLRSRDAHGEYLWDGFVGMTPETNRLAVAFALRCGFRKVGVVPFGAYDFRQNKSVPAVLTVLEREEA